MRRRADGLGLQTGHPRGGSTSAAIAGCFGQSIASKLPAQHAECMRLHLNPRMSSLGMPHSSASLLRAPRISFTTSSLSVLWDSCGSGGGSGMQGASVR